jgi:type II secretory pathway pseudopilin PulG
MSNCPSCGAPYPPGATYCATCGQPVAAVPPAKPDSGKAVKTIVFIAVGAGCLLFAIAALGIVAALVIPNFINAKARAQQTRTMADQRSIATALEGYRADKNAYPAVATAAELGPVLAPYGHQGAAEDGWKHPLRYSCLSTGSEGCDSYELASPGRDGVFESEPGGYTQGSFEPTAYDSDLVIGDGLFTRWPEGKGRAGGG